MRSMRSMLDAVIVGSGPNGLAAAITLAQAGQSVVVLEGKDEPGGGVRSAQLTLPGFQHDICSTTHPLACWSPAFRSLGIERKDIVWRHSAAPLAHIIDESQAVNLERSISETAAQLGVDRARYEDLVSPLVQNYEKLLELVGPLRVPSSPIFSLSFASKALLSMTALARPFRNPAARALLAGLAAHSMLPLDRAATSAIGLVLAAAGHAVGWPVAEGGSGQITRALVELLQEAGGELRVDHHVSSVQDLPEARVYLMDVAPAQLLSICAGSDWLPPTYSERLSRYRHGPGVFKIDWALSEPVPWAHPRCRRATTLHLSGSLEQIHLAESTVHDGRVPEEPFLLFVQPCLADPTRAPAGAHIGWAYCNVPPGSTASLTEHIEARIDRFAPGFRDTILARATRSAAELEVYNPNYVGGDISGGMATLGQTFFRPTPRIDPYSTPNPRLFLCSASTPPGGGVHGICGHFAAQSALRRLRS